MDFENKPNCQACKHARPKEHSVYLECSKVLEKVGGIPGLVSICLFSAPNTEAVTLKNVCDKSLQIMGLEIQDHAFNHRWCFYPLEYNPCHLRGSCKYFEEEQLVFGGGQ